MTAGVQGRTTTFVAYAPADVRAQFIRKVYTLLFSSVLLTVGVGAFCSQGAVAGTMIGLMPIFSIAGIVCIIALMFTRRMPVVNTGLFYLFAALQGAVFGPALLMVDRQAPGVPVAAAFLTTCVFGGLSLYAVQSKKDFSYLGGMLFAGLIALVVAGFVLMFFQTQLLGTLYALGDVLIFSGYVLYDTSQIMLRLGPDEAVAGAISLYLDLLNMFWFILQLLTDFNRRD